MSQPFSEDADNEISSEVALPPDLFNTVPTTGTVDDDDDPADERDDENEAPVHENSDQTDATREFQDGGTPVDR